MVTATTTTTSLSISAGAIAGIVLGGIALVVLVFWIYSFLRVLSFYRLNDASAPNELLKANENDCVTMLCLNLNQSLVVKFDPSLAEKVEKRNAYLKVKQDNVIGIVTPTTGGAYLPLDALSMGR